MSQTAAPPLTLDVIAHVALPDVDKQSAAGAKTGGRR